MCNMNTNEKEEYDSVPVFYCKQCMSLKILTVPKIEDSEYCDDCGSTNIGQCDIKEWERMYLNIHGFNYINNKL